MKSKSTNLLTSRPLMVKCVLTAVAVFLIGGVVGWYSRKHTEVPTGKTTLLRENSTNYKFINPIILAQVPENTTVPQLQVLKKTVTDYVTTAKNQKKVIDTSIYFRQLNTDSWVGVNTDDLYAPASLLKVVSMIAFMHATQQNPLVYSTGVTIDPSSINADGNQDYYPPAQTVQPGHSYTTEELLSRMIINSDNNAAFALDQVTGRDILDKTYTDLTIPNPDSTQAIDFMSPRLYSRVLRLLYNGAYLSPSVSEQALDLLSRSTFTQGLVAGVPVGTVVAHKFGERTIGIQDADNPANSQTIKELHDCGIIYAPNDPYLLCVMTKGTDFPALQKVISDISAMSWKTVQQLDGKKG